jgi:hypothetical protein
MKKWVAKYTFGFANHICIMENILTQNGRSYQEDRPFLVDL